MKHIQENITKTIHKFLLLESELFNISTTGVHEQSISHRLAVLFEQDIMFSKYNIDCEYNKHGDATKTLKDLEDIVCGCGNCRKAKSEELERKIRPDIIIHKRCCDKNNLVCIEIKKSENCNYDIAKVKKMTLDPYSYALGVFINFNNGKKPIIKFFQNGEEI